MVKLSTSLGLLFFVILFPVFSYASEPVVYFSDIISGPKTGLDDGKGQGAIITVWGRNLGSTQGNSKIYVGEKEAYVYYWENSDPATGDSGPADMYSRHGMQEIAFSISSSAADGPGKIYAIVDNVKTNELDFTIRAGNIYHVKTTGNDANSGSWASPWRSMDYAASGNRTSPGDIVYISDGMQETDGWNIYYINGTEGNRIAYIAYPGANVLATGAWGIGNFDKGSSYLVFSKFSASANSTVITHFKRSRIVGNEVTDIDSASCSCGGIGDAAYQEGAVYFGNYIHDFGGPTSSNQTHPTYFTLREAVTGITSIQGFEFAWNYLKDNDSRSGIHFYDEHGCGGYTTTVSIHHNVVENQTSACLDIVAQSCDTGYSLFGDFEIFNNLFIGCGQKGSTTGDYSAGAFIFQGKDNYANIKFFNNTIYGWGGSPGSWKEAFIVQRNIGIFSFAGTWEFKNNIIVDTQGIPFSLDPDTKPPTASSNNLWYSVGSGGPSSVPFWDSSSSFAEPKFINTSSRNFTLQFNSPAINSGTSTVSGIVTKDLKGVARPKHSEYDIGAYEYLIISPTNLRKN